MVEGPFDFDPHLSTLFAEVDGRADTPEGAALLADSLVVPIEAPDVGE